MNFKAPGARAEPGLLVALRAVELYVDFLHELPQALITEARVFATSAQSWQYEFRVWHQAELLAQGRALVMLHG